jgi:hypothetical protein
MTPVKKHLIHPGRPGRGLTAAAAPRPSPFATPAQNAAWVSDVKRWLFGGGPPPEPDWHDTQPGVMHYVGPLAATRDELGA